MQLVAKGYTESVASLAPRLRPAWTCVGNVQSDPLVSRQADISPKLNQDTRETCHGFLAGARPSLTAIFTRSARESAFIFCIILPRCAFTVISLIPSFKPTCLFNMPVTINFITSRSRGVSDV